MLPTTDDGSTDVVLPGGAGELLRAPLAGESSLSPPGSSQNTRRERGRSGRGSVRPGPLCPAACR